MSSVSGVSGGRSQVEFAEHYLPLLRGAGLADYESVMSSAAGTKMVKANLGRRERIRLTLTAIDGTTRTVYLKRYGTNGPAEDEWRGLKLTRAAGVPTAEPIGMGIGPRGGFVLLSAVPGDALSRTMDDLLARRGGDVAAMKALAETLGRMAGTFHAAGLAHRDFYAAHVFMREAGPGFDLYLIDLARVFRPRWRRWRWRIKDLAQLKVSLPEEWVERHWPALRAAYVVALGERLGRRADRRIESRVAWMRRRIRREEGKVL